MAYVNMTVDGSTKKTDKINLVGSDGTTKVALLEALLEDSDGGGSAIATGTFTPTEDTYEMMWDLGGTFDNLLLYKMNDNLSGYGKRVCALLFYTKDLPQNVFVGSNNAGSATAGGYVSNTGAFLTIEGTKASFKSGGAFIGALVPEEYKWVAW